MLATIDDVYPKGVDGVGNGSLCRPLHGEELDLANIAGCMIWRIYPLCFAQIEMFYVLLFLFD